MKNVLVRTHGGLGNQIFQIFYGRLYAKSRGLVLEEIHDSDYEHRFLRSTELGKGSAPTNIESLISRMRIPKLMNKYLGMGEKPFEFGRTTYIDGYYQNIDSYNGFSDDLIQNELRKISNELAIQCAWKEEVLVHFRLGDFYVNRVDAAAHVNSRLEEIPLGSHIISNDEELLKSLDMESILSKKNARIISTKKKSPEELMRMMASYSEIRANDSTMVFWARVLGNSRVVFINPRLRILSEHFNRIMWS